MFPPFHLDHDEFLTEVYYELKGKRRDGLERSRWLRQKEPLDTFFS